MSNRALAWAFEQKLANPFQQMVLHAVADWADPTGQARQCDLHYLAETVRLSATKVRKHLSELRTAGVINTAEKFTEEGQRVYDIALHLEKTTALKREVVPDTKPSEPKSETPTSAVYPKDSVEARAIIVLHDIAMVGEFARRVYRQMDGSIRFTGTIDDRLRAITQARKPDEWVTLNRQQAAAWESFLRDHVKVNRPRKLAEGSRAPWYWPPKSDGSLYTSATGPPETLMSEQDEADFK